MRDPRPMEQIFFEAFAEHLRGSDLPAQLTELTAERPFHGLLTQLPDFGATRIPLTFEISAPPGVRDEGSRAFLVQIFVTLGAAGGEGRLEDLFWLTSRLNGRVAVGAFGVMEEADLLYYKNALVVDAEAPAGAQVRQVDLQVGLMVHMLHTFFDLLQGVAAGEDAVQGLAGHPLAAAFAQAG